MRTFLAAVCLLLLCVGSVSAQSPDRVAAAPSVAAHDGSVAATVATLTQPQPEPPKPKPSKWERMKRGFLYGVAVVVAAIIVFAQSR